MKRRYATSVHHSPPFLFYILLSASAFFLGVIATIMVTRVLAQGGGGILIRACVNNDNGNVRIVGSDGKCKNNESPTSWSSQAYFGLPFFCQNCYLASVADKFAGKDFSNAQIYRSVFDNADLTGVNFKGAFFSNVGFKNANLTRADFSNIHDFPGWDSVKNLQFNAANLTDANFSNSTFQAAEFNNADLQNTNFENTIFKYSDFSGALHMSSANLNGTTWISTKCSDGTNSDSHGNTCVGH